MAFFSTEKLLSQLAALIRERVDKKSVQSLEIFARRYYQHVAEQDLEALSLDDIYGAVLSHWNFAQKRPLGQAKIRVFNPSLEQHSWQSSHTVIEIVVEDMPFLVQSTLMEINRLGFTNHLTIHPILRISRDPSGKLLETIPGHSPMTESVMESFIHVEIARQSDEKVRVRITDRLIWVLNRVSAAYEDWNLCIEALESGCRELSEGASALADSELEEALAFLRWLVDKHYVFLGFREYKLFKAQGKHGFKANAGSGLGILRDTLATDEQSAVIELSDDGYRSVAHPTPLMITKSTTLSMVHRPVYLDYIGIKRFNDRGEVVGELRFLGLYSSLAYRSLLDGIPIVRKKLERVFQRAGFAENSHSGRTFQHIIEELPRDEVFYSSEEDLFELAMGVFFLRDRQRVRVFVRHDVYGQYFSVLVYVPRENFHTNNRKTIQAILLRAFNGQSLEFQVVLSESLLARIHFMIHVCETCTVEFDIKEIEQKIIEGISEWKDGLHQALVSQYGEEQCDRLISKYGDGFSAGYREDFRPRSSVVDILQLEALEGNEIKFMLYRPLEVDDEQLRFKLYCQGRPVPLSITLPMLENMGVTVVDEKPYRIGNKANDEPFWIHDFGLSFETEETIEFQLLKPSFEETFERVWRGQVENDGFNRLTIKANMNWKSIVLFRAFYFYLRQIGIAFSQNYVEWTLENNPRVVKSLLKGFNARFDPLEADQELRSKWKNGIGPLIDHVKSLDEDRILRRYVNLIQATVRTNFFQNQTDDNGIPYFSFKIDPAVVNELPLPRPFFEIFVYSPRVEGVHLRGGPVARGGLRWSDRREDFRTEILGLLKAQMAKNAIIVPSGAKGGFVIKREPKGDSKQQLHEEAVSCYRIFIHALLDITDNLLGNEIKKPDNTVCHDSDDPYLVVAADKGTATFSDIANSVADKYGFWLGDAFASGGSRGYDHKKMGITARGGWVSVEHHFLELGIDIKSTPFSVVGIGDMSGDVFGNGMLLSKQIRLVGAFNHQHIFLDPSPDPESSYMERKRLFAMPGSTWIQYDRNLISRGGGVFSRRAKSIVLTEEVKEVLGLTVHKMTPDELIRSLLKAPVDLLWNGGIGTYVKASQESHLDAGDRTNDSVRIDACEMQCKVVGEGGNLGFTQKARIEFSRLGGKINTDSVDNSAGVDCSDHEVNIKILLDQIVRDGDLTQKQRNSLLYNMTSEVAELVLRNNRLRAQAITMIERQSKDMLISHKRVIGRLEQQGRLDRSLESLADDDELNERKIEGKGLFRPEVSVVMAYCKLALKNELLACADKLDSDQHKRELALYFPKILSETFPERLSSHYLGKEIITNQLVNSVVNRLGVVFPFRLIDESGADDIDLIRVYCEACMIFEIPRLWDDLESLCGAVDPSALVQLTADVRRSLERTMFWLLQTVPCDETRPVICADLKVGVDTLSGEMLSLLLPDETAALNDRVEKFVEAKVPHRIAYRIASLNRLFTCLDVIAVSRRSHRALVGIAKLFFVIDENLGLRELRSKIGLLPRDDYWQSLARTALRDEFHRACRACLADILKSKKRSFKDMMDSWWLRRKHAIDRYRKLVHDFQLEDAQELEKLSVAVKALNAISQP